MEIEIYWHEPVILVDGSDCNLIYNLEKSYEIPDIPGVYIFARQHGDSLNPIYVGKAQSFSTRIPQQLNNARLMKGIENCQSGQRILLLGELIAKSGQQLEKVLKLIESTIIQYFLAEGLELLNIKGARTSVDTINFTGNRDSKNLFPGGGSMTKMRK